MKQFMRMMQTQDNIFTCNTIIKCGYDYSPYGAVTAEGTAQPIQWSSEYHDPELALTYYNYRHYNPTDGRWINRDPIGEDGGFNLYGFIENSPLFSGDYLGQKECNEDTYMHFQDFYFTVTLHTLLDSDIKISDPQTVIADSIKDFLGEAAVLGAADKADVVKDLKKIRKKTPKENLFRLFAEGLSSAGGYLDSITIELTAQYCCYSCENREEKYQWKPAAGTVYMSGILADIKHPKGLEEASNKLIHSMVAAAESLKNNACRED